MASDSRGSLALTPFFSIGVTTYKRRELLKETLASIVRQTFSDFEVVVGNDYPLECLSAELLGIEDPRIRFVNHPQNLGEVGNMNSLLGMGCGRYFTWLADDDLYVPEFLQAVHTALTRFDFPRCVFTSYMSGTIYSDIENSLVGEQRLLTGRRFLREYLARSMKTQGCYGVFDIQYIRRIGGIQQLGNGFSPYADNLLAIRAGLLEKVVYIDAPLIFFRTHEGAISWTSPDVDAYIGAQEDLCEKSVEVLRSEELRRDFESNLFLLLRWCLNDFCTVVLRSRSLQIGRLMRYLVCLRRYTRLLGSYRYSMTIMTVRSIGKMMIQLTADQVVRLGGVRK